ncbi:MAG: hypothetical protein JXB00_06500 [Bacteroidales bacterium]|nr:hypothetical protein [Bacteroidales bacterium]
MKVFRLITTLLFLIFIGTALTAQDETGCVSGNCENGSGTYIYSNGYHFKGDFKNGKREGRGMLTCPDGSSYEGMWANDEFNGQGTYKWADGAKYSGEWKNGVQDGYGIYFYPNGDKYTGYFKNNKFHGKGTYTWAGGESVTGIYENGELKNTVNQ